MSLDDFYAELNQEAAEDESRKRATAMLNLHTGYGANPADEAEKVRISRETGVPVEVMDDPEVRNDAGRQAFMKTVDVKDNPGTIDFLTYQQNAKVAMRQIREISGVERALRNLAVGATRDVLGSGIKGMGAIINARGRIAENIPGSQLPFEFGLPRLAHEIGLGDVLTNAGENIKQYYGQFAPKGEQAFGDQVASGVGQMAPQLAMFSNPFTAPLGVAMMAGQGTDQMAEKIAMDKESQKASQYRQDMELLSGGLITAVTEWATSKFQLKGLQALVLKNRLLDKTVKIVLGGVEEGAQEFSENLGQDLVHIAATNPDSQLALGQAIEAGEVGGIVGTIAQSVIQGALHIRTRGTQRRYQELSDASKAQKLRDMEPATYQDFVDRVTANLAGSTEGAVTDIYVDANTFHQVMLENKIDPDEVAMAVPSIGQQMAEARATGGDIVIPMNEFAGKIAGTEIGDALEPHIRSTADAYSVAELDAATKFAPAFDEQMRSISEKTQAYRDWMASQKEVRDTVYNQLVETGTYTKAASRSFSALVGNFYATQAREMGMTPAELYARLPYKVLAGEITRGQMTQGGKVAGFETLGDLRQSWQERGIENFISEKDGAISLSEIKIPKEERKKGIGTQAMQELSAYADRTGQSIVLTPSKDYGATSVKRLEKFYKRFGFASNKGKNKDFHYTETMIRRPQSAILNQAAITSDAENFSRQLDDYAAGKIKPRSTVTVGKTPYILEKLGAEQLPLVITKETVDKSTTGKHGLSLDSLKELPKYINDPIMVFESATQADSLVVMTELKQDGKTIVAAVHLSKEQGRNIVNNIASVYGKDSDGIFIKWINDGLLRYINKEKSRAWSVTSRLQLPTVRGSKLGSGKKILFDYDLVKDNLLYQQPTAKRGGFNPETMTTVLGQKADYSTFLHESAHFFLTAYSQMAAMPEATPQIQEDMQTVLDWFGVKDLNEWNALTLEQQRKHHEAFAYNFEIYLFGGKAPSIKMQGVFERFAAWLKKVYQSIRDELNAVYRQEHGTDLPVLTGEVKQVMDRMLASDQQIEQAEYAASMGAIFQTQAESGMDDATWAAYLDMQEEAHQDAVREHRKASMRQMKWLSGAKSKYVKLLQTEANFQRGKITEQVIKEVNEMPIYVAKDAMKNATPDEQMAIADGMGYKSIEELNLAIANAPKKSAVVKEEVDRRMLEENGELVDPRIVEQKVNEAIHNEARQRFIAVELRHLAKATQPVRIMQAAARMAAQKMLGRKTIFELRPRDYVAAEARAGKAAQEALKAGDFAGAVKAKENQLLQNALAVEAMKARGEVETALKNWKKLFRPDDKVAKTHDMNYVGVARAILAKYTYGKDPIGASDKPASYYVDNIKKYDPDFFAEIEGLLGGLDKEVKDIKQTSLNEFRDLVEQVGALWHLSRRNKQSEIDGQLVDRTEIVRELNDHLRSMNLKEFRPGYNKAVTGWEKKQMMFMGVRAAFRRVEAWVDAMDGNRPGKPFRKYIWNPISDAVTKYRLEKTKYLKEYVDLIGEYKHLFNQKPIASDADGINYTFNTDPKNGSELIHALLHTGNDSNKRKLLVGRGWATIDEATGIMDTRRWDKFIADSIDKGAITKDHYDFCQKVWDLMERMKPAAQKAHHDMYGYYFDEITADPIATKWGIYNGGYVPAVTDPDLVTEAEMHGEQELTMGDNSFMFPTTGRGFTMKRVEYNKQLLLNISSLAGHIDKVLKFAYIEPRVKDVARIIKTNRAFGEAMDAIDPTIRGDMLVPWLQRTAMQMVSMPSTGKAGRAADKAFTWLRTNTGMQMMVGNITNTLQQFTGIPIVITKVKAHYVRNALWQFVRAPKEATEFVSVKSDYMKTRVDNYAFEMQATMDAYLNDVKMFDKLQDFAQKHGYFLQQGTQGIVDTIAWISAYNQAAEQNMDEADAIREADSVVRETQGSFAPEDISRIETLNAFVRMFTHFYSYFNMLANLNATEFTKTVREMGVKRGMGRLLHTYAFGFMIPAVMAEIIVQAAGGFDTGDDDEWDFWDAFCLFFGAQGRALAGMVPGVGPAIMAGFNAFNSKPYDDRISTSPAVSAMEGVVRTPFTVCKAIADDGSWKRAGKDMLTTLGIISGLPLGQLGKPVGYLADVAQGKAKPERPMDVVRGVISGKDVNRKQ